jgi:hypothetical protein
MISRLKKAKNILGNQLFDFSKDVIHTLTLPEKSVIWKPEEAYITRKGRQRMKKRKRWSQKWSFTTGIDRFDLADSLYRGWSMSSPVTILPTEGEDRRMRTIKVDRIEHLRPKRVAAGLGLEHSVEYYYFSGTDDCGRQVQLWYDFITKEGVFQDRLP